MLNNKPYSSLISMSGQDFFKPFGNQYLMPPGEIASRELDRPALDKNCGPIIGQSVNRRVGGMATMPVYQKGQGNLLTVAPPGTGKSTTQAIPCALTWPGSLIVTDPKGEILRATIGRRRHELDQDCYVIDPAGLVYEDGGHRWNIIDEILGDFRRMADGEKTNIFEDLAYLGRLLIERDANPEAQQWGDWADQTYRMGLVAVLAMAASRSEESLTLPEALRRVASGGDMFKETLDELRAHDEPYMQMLVGMGEDLLNAPEQMTGIRTTLFRRLEPLAYPALNRALSASDFSFGTFRGEGQRPKTLYIVVPPHEMQTYKPLIRLVLGWALRSLMRDYSPERDDADPPALFLMDEVAQLGYMDVLESAMQIARGYNVKFWFFIQSVSFLQQYYPKSWKMFFETSQMISSFGLTDVDTAEIFSKMVGSTTVVKPSFSQSSGSSESVAYTKGSHSSSGQGGASSGTSSSTTDTYGTNSSTSKNYDLVGRRVVMAEELLRLDPNDQLVFFRGLPALMCQKLHYSASRQLREMVNQGLPALAHLIDPEGLQPIADEVSREA